MFNILPSLMCGTTDLQIAEENGLLKVIGTDRQMENTTVLSITNITNASSLDGDSFLKLANLEELGIENCPVFFPQWIKEFRKLKRIYLRGVTLSTEESNTLYLPECLEEISLICCKTKHRPRCLTSDTFKGLPNLKSVRIEHPHIVKLPSSLKECKSLECLALDYPRSLKELKNNLDGFGNLKSIYLEDSYDYHYKHSVAILQALFNLENLESICIKAECIFLMPECFKGSTKLRSLKFKGVSAFPEQIYRFENLLELRLQINCSYIAESIGDLQHLRLLDLSGNKLSTIPESVKKLNNLAYLNLKNTGIQSISEAIGDLKNLVSLNLSGNNLSTIPESISQLERLKELNLDGNKLTRVPKFIGNLKELGVLNLSRNLLASLPRSFESMTQLVVLDLRDNHILALPKNGDDLGAIELETIFGDKFLFNHVTFPEPQCQ